MRKKYKKGLNTCIVEFGMNPGLISCFVKECIHQVILNDQSLYIRIYRKKLLKLYEEKKYGLICKKIKVKEVQEVDNDDQVTNIPFEENTLYSTWNPWPYYYETISSPEIAYGTKKEYLSYDKIFLSDYKNLVLSLYKAGFENIKKILYPPKELFMVISQPMKRYFLLGICLLISIILRLFISYIHLVNMR